MIGECILGLDIQKVLKRQIAHQPVGLARRDYEVNSYVKQIAPHVTIYCMAFSLPSFGSFFSKETKSALGIDIGTSSIKVVQLKRDRGSVILETYGAIALGPYAGVEIGRATALDAGKLAEALKDVIREANVTVTDAAVAIPYSSSLVSIIKLPKATEKELATVVPIEARKYIPVPINEVLLDYFPDTGGAEK